MLPWKNVKKVKKTVTFLGLPSLAKEWDAHEQEDSLRKRGKARSFINDRLFKVDRKDVHSKWMKKTHPLIVISFKKNREPFVKVSDNLEEYDFPE